MKKFLIGLAVLMVVVIAAAFAAPFVIPADRYKGWIAAEVHDRTGLTLRLDGPIRVSVLPALAIELNNVAIAGPAGPSSPDLLKLKSLDAELAVAPLLRGTLEVRRFVVVEPDVTLAVDKSGVLDLGRLATRPPAAAGQAAPAAPASPAAATPAGSGRLAGLRLGSVRVDDGRLRWLDERTGASYVATAINATLTAPDLDHVAELVGDLVLQGRKVMVQSRLDTPRALMSGSSAKTYLSLDSELSSLKFDGTASFEGGAPHVHGQLEAASINAGALMAWMRNDPAAALPIKAVNMSGLLDASRAKIVLDPASLTVDDRGAHGALAITLDGPRPKIAGAWAVDRLDLDRYLPPPSAPLPPAGAPASGTPAAAAPHAQAAGWSEAPIALSGLKAADVDLKLRVAGLTIRQVDIGASALNIAVADGRLTADLGETAVYDGTVSGRLTADGAAPVPAVGVEARVNGVQAQPVLAHFASFDRLTGTCRLVASLHAAGASQKAMVEQLGGEGSVTLTNGAIKGINIAEMVRSLSAGGMTGGAPLQTDFAELSGTFKIVNGVLQNDDLKLLAPLLRVTGKGQVSLPARQVAYRLEPRLVGSLQGQGGGEQTSNLVVPIVVSGTFDELRFTPDLAGAAQAILSDPKAAKGQLEQLKKAIEGGQGGDQAKNALKNLLGGGAQPAPPPAAGSPPGTQANPPAPLPKPGDLLRGLFGK